MSLGVHCLRVPQSVGDVTEGQVCISWSLSRWTVNVGESAKCQDKEPYMPWR